MVSKVLVIGEKPSQIKTFSEILFTSIKTTKVGARIYTRTGSWGGYSITFLPLIGHITNIDTRKGFGWNECPPISIAKNPKALIIKENHQFKKVIQSLAVTSDELWLATDPDSEGDNIAYEAYMIAIQANASLKNETKRVWNSSLTKQEIIRAFQNLIPWELYLALAVQGRRMVDAWVGFAGTREVTGTARRVIKQKGLVLSVGRVQLPTLKLIVDRDRERGDFQQKYKYNIIADVLSDDRKEVLITVKHEKSPFDDEKPVKIILEKIKNATEGRVIEFKSWKDNTPPPKPWNTTDALALLTKKLKIKANAALSLLTTLYENGFISYPRTENRCFKDNFPHNEILSKLEKFSGYKPLLKSVTSSEQVRSNGRKQGVEDHDPIHPTGEIPRENAIITTNHLIAWDFIARYYIGMFLPDLIQTKGLVRVSIKEEIFNQKYQNIASEGWVKAITWKKPIEFKEFKFEKNQIVQVTKIRSISFKTKPPPQWNDSSLIRTLERLGIGTKSSRPEILSKLESRKYIVRQSKTFYESTERGKTIIKVFEGIWPELVTPSFTRMVESMMDEVAEKKESYESMLESLRQKYILLHQKLLSQLPELQELLERETQSSRENNQRNTKSKPDNISTNCPLCKQGESVQRINRKTNNIFFGCSNYPKCRWTAPSKKTRDGKIVPAVTAKDIVGSCPDCSGTLFLKSIKDFRLVGCSEYPKCKVSYFLPKNGRLTVLKNKTCPKCKLHMISQILSASKNVQSKRKVFCAACGG